jgi:predicted amidophosphoribosyltransferase
MVSVLPQLEELKGAALDFVFPRFCVGCGKEGDFICNACQASLPWIESPICPKCGKLQTGLVLCPNCNNWEADIDAICSPFRFEGVIRKTVHEFKYHNLAAIAGQLAHFLGDYLIDNPILYDVIVPVPLHYKRLKERGYNQAALLSIELSRLTGIHVNGISLIRCI